MVQSGRGKGDASTGFAAVTGNLIVMLDADGSAMPSEIPSFVAALEAAPTSQGVPLPRGRRSDDITLLRSRGNAVLSGTANLIPAEAIPQVDQVSPRGRGRRAEIERRQRPRSVVAVAEVGELGPVRRLRCR